jgi:hypothetical protein
VVVGPGWLLGLALVEDVAVGPPDDIVVLINSGRKYVTEKGELRFVGACDL